MSMNLKLEEPIHLLKSLIETLLMLIRPFSMSIETFDAKFDVLVMSSGVHGVYINELNI